jgi:hypothetical protein
MNTDTPRTEAARFEALRSSAFRQDCIPLKLGQQLERELKDAQEAYLKSVERDDYLTQELAASKAEVERLQTLPESRHQAFLDLLARAEKAEAEAKEIRNALGDDGRRTHKELIQLATKASGWREWKKKYIDLKNAHIAEGQDPAGTIWEHADKLQAQLKASQAESESRRQSLAFALNEIKKAEAEVERLKEQLESTKLLALKFWKVLEENGFKLELPK